ncbi:MAG: hypothetical protein COB53_13545 [Elusimicrobia bacterium]|nr:MAG: hypothetical protein COB53_13545 [Elusimicrobiota bacterium]
MPSDQFSIADETVAPWVAAAAALALYLALPSFRFNHDGVACAIAIELADVKHLLHGNHLLYGWLGMVFHGIVQALKLPLTALWSLQLMDSMLGALGTGLFCRLLLKLKLPVWIAWLASMGLATSYGWWLFSIDAQVYLLGAMFMILAWTEALSEKPNPYRLALWNSLGVLGHVLNVFFAPAALYSLWRSRDGITLRKDFMRYAFVSIVFVTSAYAIAGIYGVKPADLEEFKVWMLGSAALGPGRSFRWYMPDSLATGIFQLLQSGFRVVSAYWAVGAVLWLGALAATFSRNSAPRYAIRTAWLGIIGTLPILLTYEPYSIDYRVTDLVPLWLMAALWMRGDELSPPVRVWPVVLVACIAAANMSGGLRSIMTPEMNRPYQKALWLKGTLPPHAWVASSALDEVYVPYFAHLRPLNLRYLQKPGQLKARIESLARRGEPVFIAADTVKSLGVERFVGLGLQPIDQFDEFELFLIRTHGAVR